MKNILEYLEKTARTMPDKDAFVCEDDHISFGQLRTEAALYGMRISALAGGVTGRPVCVIGERDLPTLLCMLACIYSGNFYVLIDASLPEARIKSMLDSVDFIGAVSCDGKPHTHEKLLFSDAFERKPVVADRMRTAEASGTDTGTDPCADRLTDAGAYTGPDTATDAGAATGTNTGSADQISAQIDRMVEKRLRGGHSFDPLYGIFTSGTTGVPKLVVKSHAAMIRFLEDFVDMFGFSSNDILGNQFPFYFDASTKDLFCCLKCGLTVHIIPKMYFSFPQYLIHYLIDHRITRIIWVPSALTLVANADSLETIGTPSLLEKVFFVGEQMPVRQLNYWKRRLPQTEFINLYGATETAGNFLYYIYDHMLGDEERLPTGKPFPDTKVILLSEDGKEITQPGRTGEICVVSATLAMGYYGNPEMTGRAFVQNPLVPYRETMYRTGDLAVYDEAGNIVWTSRRDYQIKHMGYRIELSEIEVSIGALPGIEECCCTYDEGKKKILLYYQARTDLKKEIARQVREKLPKYMYPSKYIRLETMPHNANGKIDRKRLAGDPAKNSAN